MRQGKQHPEIFKVFPSLEGKLPWVPLCDFPTPVHRLKRIGHANLWIKRDDLSSPLYGGNKVRKLEFILAKAKQKNKTHIVTCGGIGTHHGLATALFGSRMGFKTSILLFDQPVTKSVRQNLLLLQKYDARLIYRKTLLRAMVDFYLFQRIHHPRAYFLYPGSSNTTGTIGYVNAVFELKNQIEQGLIPQPDVVFCPVGSNGTQAGLYLGMRLAGLPAEVIGVRVSVSHVGPFAAATPANVKNLIKTTSRHLKDLSGKTSPISIPQPRMLQSYFGRGYGHPTTAGRNAARAMRVWLLQRGPHGIRLP